MNDRSATHPVFICGPCVIESSENLEQVAQELVRINRVLGVDIIFKSSFDKANRTSLKSYRGPGIDKGLQMLVDIKSKYQLRILTDIHEAWQADRFARGSGQDGQDCQHQEGSVSER